MSTPKRRPNPSPALGAFLSARRAALDPAAAGMFYEGYRRVTGLRREEVAVLAGVSVDYYTRLEQGREHHPSPAVIDALCHALRLGGDARDHLYRLAGTMPLLHATATTHEVSAELRLLLAQLSASPALVLNARFDVLARNELAVALHRGFTLRDNSARMLFLDPLGLRFYADWRRTAEGTVAALRLAAGQSPDDRELSDLVDELSGASEEFRELWGAQTVRAKTNETKHFLHPDVGDLELSYQSFDVRDVPGQQLVVFGAYPGTPTAEKLQQLAELSRPMLALVGAGRRVPERPSLADR